MPEGPEARVVADQLNERLVGYTLRGHWELGLLNRIYTVGKQLYFIFNSSDVVLNFGLGMQGHWFFEETIHLAKGREPRMTLEWGEYSDDKQFFLIKEKTYFDDADRKASFGFLSHKETIEKIKGYPYDWMQRLVPQELPPSLLSKALSPGLIKVLFKPKRVDKMICDVMLDQKITSGIGNYIKSESLYRANIHPHHLISSITDDEFDRLENSLCEVFLEAYATNGLTHGTFLTPNGGKGTFNTSVYRRTHCPLGHLVTMSKSKGDRSNYYCSHCLEGK